MPVVGAVAVYAQNDQQASLRFIDFCNRRITWLDGLLVDW